MSRMTDCPYCGVTYSPFQPHTCDPLLQRSVYGHRTNSREELRSHWIREHLPVMALDYMKTHSYEDCAKKSLELIDACLDAVCKGGDDGK